MRWFLRLFRKFRELEADVELLREEVRHKELALGYSENDRTHYDEIIRSLGTDKSVLQDRVIELEAEVRKAQEEVKAAKDRELETLRSIVRPVPPSGPPTAPVFGRRQISRRVAEVNTETRTSLAELFANNGEIKP